MLVLMLAVLVVALAAVIVVRVIDTHKPVKCTCTNGTVTGKGVNVPFPKEAIRELGVFKDTQHAGTTFYVDSDDSHHTWRISTKRGCPLLKVEILNRPWDGGDVLSTAKYLIIDMR